ncbi:hypothetical protein AFK68_08050 [Hydrocoleum sp. CS-953]|uniref:hypothetical protein n=1 Tax=Hydrocoleum sp. CS-953 TaxID=1671698 RepID=UPI000B9C1A38|nr:hypothetical protein [Hydrocoleum sp. CS-953]OZH54882.1 hypothetical protein AFK68_08050 [Hydrocoleum sp. CS-953]
MKQDSQNNRQTFGDEIRAAKEFADSYGPELLDRLLRVVENDHKMPDTSQTTVNLQTNNILQEVEKAGFQLNHWLTELILNTNVEVVRNAMAVVAVYRRRRMTTLRNPEGMLVEAIRNRWRPHISA